MFYRARLLSLFVHIIWPVIVSTRLPGPIDRVTPCGHTGKRLLGSRASLFGLKLAQSLGRFLDFSSETPILLSTVSSLVDRDVA